jgi:hypothetical protein
MRQLGVIAVPGTSPKLTHGAELPTNHPVAALIEKPGNEGWSRSIPLADIEICFDEHDCLELRVPRF